jgi:hypothetical protein
MADDEKRKLQLLNYLKSLVAKDSALRKKYNIGDRYKVIATRLKNLVQYVERNTDMEKALEQSSGKSKGELNANQMLVYVYLFNTNGRWLQRWTQMFSKKNLYEYGFNRPIYLSEKAVQSYINSREFKDEHAYIAVVVNKDDASEGQAHLTDSLEQPLIKIKEAALLMDNISYFWHREEKYSLTRDQLVPFDEG